MDLDAAAEGCGTAEERWEGMSPGCPGGAGKGPAVPGDTHTTMTAHSLGKLPQEVQVGGGKPELKGFIGEGPGQP